MSEPLYIYAELLDESGSPIEVHNMPALYTISQKLQPNDEHRTLTNQSFGRYARVVGHLPSEFCYWPGSEKCYKVELEPSDLIVRQWLKQCMASAPSSINRTSIQLESSVQLPDEPSKTATPVNCYEQTTVQEANAKLEGVYGISREDTGAVLAVSPVWPNLTEFSDEVLLFSNQGKHVWKGGLLELAGILPHRCIKCRLTQSELELQGNAVCNGVPPEMQQYPLTIDESGVSGGMIELN